MESFVCNKKNGGQHVNKRKRQCTALEKSKSFSSKALSLNSNDFKSKANDSLDMPMRAIGSDGHFYVCVKCEDVGELLCCDTCSCTYHLYCLNPPLESTPEGDWQCPNCYNNDNFTEPKLNFEGAVSSERHSLNKASNSSSNCSLCSKTKKILILTEDEIVRSRSSSTDQLDLLVGFDKCVTKYHGGPSVSGACTGDNIIQQNPNKTDDKLLILRDVLQEVVQEIGMTEQKNKEAADTMNQLVPVDTQSRQLQKHKSAKLHSRQKGKQILRNTSKGTYSCSKLDVQKQSSDLIVVKYGESVRSDALANNRTDSGAQHSSLVTFSRKDITVPSISLPKTNGSAASGYTYTSSISYGKKIDITPSGRPYGFLEHNAEKITWSELELDALWVGVRRYGQEGWDTILADPSLRVLKNKTPQNLCMKWKEELLKIFPFQKLASSLPSTIPTERSTPTIVDRRKGIKDATTLQLLPSNVPFPFLKSGTFGSYNHGSSSSRASPSFPKAHDTDIAPHWVPNLNMKPVVSELLFHTLHQKANLESNMRPMIIQALQTPAVAMATKRRSSPTRNDQPKLLLGGHFPINNENGGPSNTKSNPSRVEADED